MSDSSRQTPQKQGSHNPASFLSPSRLIRSPSSVGELVDQHKQLRHEAGGLKLQLAAKQEILDRVVDLLDSSMAELAQAKLTIEHQAKTIQELQQQLKAAGNDIDTVPSAVNTLETTEIQTETKLEANHRQPQQPPATTPPVASNPPVLTSGENTSTSQPTEMSLKPFEKLTIDLNELEQSIKGVHSNSHTGNHHMPDQPIPTPVSARDRIAAFEKASKEALLLQQHDLIGNKSPELAPQCKITAAARAGNGGGNKGKKKKGKS